MNQYETIGELDLRPATKSGQDSDSKGDQTEMKHVYDNARFREDTVKHDSKPSKSPPTPETLSQPPPESQAAASAMESESEQKKPAASGDGEKGLSSKKEKFVARVLDETLESIISQREALAGTGEVRPAEGHDSNSKKSPSKDSKSHHREDTTDTSKSSSDEERSKRRQRKAMSSPVHQQPDKTEKNDGNDHDVYAVPNKRPPLSDSDGRAEDEHRHADKATAERCGNAPGTDSMESLA